MNNSEKQGFWSDRSKVIAAGALLLVVLAFGNTMYEQSQRRDLEAAALDQRSQVERLQAEKEELARQMERASHDLRGAQESIAGLDEQRAQAERNAAAAQARLDQHSANETNAAKWRKEAEALRVSNAQSQQQVVGLQASIERLTADKSVLEARNTALRSEMDQLAANQARMDNSHAQAFRGRHERLTVLAKKTRKVQLTLELPSAMAKQASYTITGPDGKVVKGDDPAVTVVNSSMPGASLASGGKGAAPGADQVKLIYTPDRKLKAGMYKVNVQVGGRSVGTTYIALR